MKIKLIILSLAAYLLCGCSGKAVPAVTQEISLEAGSHELLTVLSDLEHILRFADPSYYIEIVDDDNWNPFDDGAVYEIEYRKVAGRTGHSESRTVSISISDTQPPMVSFPWGRSVRVPYTEDSRMMDSTVLDAIRQATIAVDNSSTEPLVLSGKNLTFSAYDPDMLDSPQPMTISIVDFSGNMTEETLEMTVYAP